MAIDLVLVPDCPHAGVARERLVREMAALGLQPQYHEHVLSGRPDDPFDGYPSPTILVDGMNITGEPRAGASACRLAGAPGTAEIRKALQARTSLPSLSGTS